MEITVFGETVFGKTHLARTIATSAEMRGFVATSEYLPSRAPLVFAACDVLSHDDLDEARDVFTKASRVASAEAVVLVSQVPPGTTRAWAGARPSRVFYQVDTIIMREALSRAYAPEQIIVGCADPQVPLPLAYQQYLMAFECPVLQMSYESAELAKCAINYVLTKQIEAANDLAEVARYVGAAYDDVRRALHGDARIGPQAYLRPGQPNQHLSRDVDTIKRLLGEVFNLPEGAVDG